MLLAYHHIQYIIGFSTEVDLKLLNSFKKRVLFAYIKMLLATIIGFSTEVAQQFSEESTVCIPS